MRRIFYLVVILIVLCFNNTKSNAQSLAGSYNVTGYFFHPTIPRTENLVKTLTQINDSVYQALVGDLDNSYNYYFQFTVNASNHLVNWRPIGSTPADTTSGFMTTDNPGGFSFYPDTTHGYTSDVYNNTYDPATQTFYMHYGYNNSGIDTGQASYTRQIYEKWVYQQVPVYYYSDKTYGGPGTVITLFGKYFTGATNVFFGGVIADTFAVVSDSVIMATVGGGSSGTISISNRNGTSTHKDDFLFIPPVVKDTSWQPVGSKGFSAGAAAYVGIALDTAGLPYIVYQNKDRGNAAVVMHYGADSTWQDVAGQASTGPASWVNIAIGTDNVPYVAYIDSTLNGPGITVRKYTGGSWQTVGQPIIDTIYNTSNKVSLALDSNNTPYILGNSYFSSTGYHYYIHHFNGSGWDVLNGGRGSDIYSGLGDASMAIDKTTNTVYVVSDNGVYGNYQGIVYRYRNGYLDTVQSGYITKNVYGVYYPDIAVDRQGVPTISFQDDDGRERVSVYRLSDNNFKPVGERYFSGNHAYRISLAVNSMSNPYVFYNDDSYNTLGSVMTPDISGDANWQYAGARGFASSKNLSQNAIVVGRNEIPYVAFADNINGNKVTVMKYSGFDLFAPRATPGLYTQGDSAACTPWVKEYPNWTSYTSTDSSGTHIEMQTQFQDDPGSICGYESFIDSSIKEAMIGNDSVILFPRNYRISFSQSPFAHQVGIRLFATTGEVNQWLSAVNADDQITHAASDVVLYQYDGPNEDYRLDNNSPTGAGTDTLVLSNYKHIKPTAHYYGSANEYCYFEFYTNHFSEFHLGIPVFGLLPLNLLSFTGKPQSQTVLLNWQTTNEINSSSFTVQRSTDGIYFTNIGKVSATNTGSNHIYNYQDDLSNLTSTTIYYRLQMVDKDGSSKESGIVSVTLSGDKKIVIVPNPAHTYFTVTGNLATKNTLLITDMSGKIALVKDNITSNEKISISALSKGIYLVKMDDGKTVTVKKLIVK